MRVEAVHALGCERCKQCRLDVDMVGLMIGFVLNDPEAKVQGAALHALGYLPADTRAAVALQQIIDDETNSPQLRQKAQRKLKYHTVALPHQTSLEVLLGKVGGKVSYRQVTRKNL